MESRPLGHALPSPLSLYVLLPQHGGHRVRLPGCSALWHHRGDHRDLGAGDDPADGDRRRPRAKHRQGTRVHATLPCEQDSSRDPSHPMVPAGGMPGVYGRLPALLGHLHRVALHLCVGLGAQAVHIVRHPLHCFHHAPHRHRLHHDRPHLLPISHRGPPMVVALSLFRRVDGLLCVRLLLFLLLRALWHVWLHADFLFLRIHADGVVRRVHHAGYHRLRFLVRVRPSHLRRRQVRLRPSGAAAGSTSCASR
mmetsp:Transcript_11041/g.28270  ORF Transcript_11041/g.28270 Transcript_11041/m.28270 type:complete len:252 (-) Transcript_11041:490-1245(-)